MAVAAQVATQPFTGFSPDAVQFLADLAANNDRAWFQPRKAEYERLLKEPMEALVAALAERFAARKIPLQADPKRSPFRIYRDTRFSKDKAPYKTHVAASFPWIEAAAGAAKGDEPSGGATAARVDDSPHGNGGYFNFQPGEMYLGGGMWMPTKERLDAFRRRLVDDPGAVRSALENRKFAAWFDGVHPHESLKRVPPGFPPDHPMAEMARWKDIVFGRRLSDQDVFSPGLPDLIADGYAAAMPVFTFLATLR